MRVESRFAGTGRVAGLDEVGRGPLAGPVVAAAVILPEPVPAELLSLLDDSKKLRPAARQAAFVALRAAAGAEIAIGAASVGEILALNILRASLLAMRRAVRHLPAPPRLALVDGNQQPDLPCEARCIVGGDGTEPAIAAASIVAKVVRDHAMALLDRRYPGYAWAENAGYGTAAHRAGLQRLGLTPHHRVGFGTVRRIALANRMVDAITIDVA